METKYAVERDLILRRKGSYLNFDGFNSYKRIHLDFKYSLEIFKKNNSDNFLVLFIDHEEDSPLSIDEVFNLFKSEDGEAIISPYKKIIKKSNFKKIRISFMDINYITLNTRELNMLVNHFVKWGFEKGGILSNIQYTQRDVRILGDVRIKKIKNTDIEIRMVGLSRIKNTYETVSFIGISQSEGLRVLNKIRVKHVHGNIESKINYDLEDVFQLKNIDRDYVEAFYRMLLCDLKEKNKGDVGMRKCDNIWDFVEYGDLRLTGKFWGDEVSGKIFQLKGYENFGDYSFEFASYTKFGLQKYDATIRFQDEKMELRKIGDLLKNINPLDYNYFTKHKSTLLKYDNNKFKSKGYDFKELEFSYVEKLINLVKNTVLKFQNNNKKENYEDIKTESQCGEIDQKDTQQLQSELNEIKNSYLTKIKQLKQHNKKIKSEYESKIKSLEQSIRDLKRNNKPVRQEYMGDRYDNKKTLIYLIVNEFMDVGVLTIKDFINKLRTSYDTCGITTFGGNYIIFNMKVDEYIFKVRIDYEESESGYVMDYKTKVLPYIN